MKKLRTVIIAAVAVLLVAGSGLVFFRTRLSPAANLTRAIAQTTAEVNTRINTSPLAILRDIYDYPVTELTADYLFIHADAQLYVDSSIIAVGSSLFDGEFYGITHNLGAEAVPLIKDAATSKVTYAKVEGSTARTATYTVINEDTGETTVVLTVDSQRISHISIKSDKLTAELDLGNSATDAWTLTSDDLTLTWVVGRGEGPSHDTITFDDTTVTTAWDMFSGGLTLTINDMQTTGSLVRTATDFYLELNGVGGFKITLSADVNAEHVDVDFIDISRDLDSFGDAAWDALDSLY